MNIKTIATNRKAHHEYHIMETIEAGIVLTGSEIKSIRLGNVSMSDAYVHPERGGLWLYNAYIARYNAASYLGHEPTRTRKLLLHRKQIRELASQDKGLNRNMEAGYGADKRQHAQQRTAQPG